MCQTTANQLSDNKDDIQTPAPVGGCGGTCKAFEKNGVCPRVAKMLKQMEKQKESITEKAQPNVAITVTAFQNNI